MNMECWIGYTYYAREHKIRALLAYTRDDPLPFGSIAVASETSSKESEGSKVKKGVSTVLKD